MCPSAVLFDLDNTLLRKIPSIPQRSFEILTEEHPQFTMDDAERIYAECELWIGRQVRTENQTGLRMSDEEFVANLVAIYAAQLSLSERERAQLEPAVIADYPRQYALMKDAKAVLDELCARGILLGVVSNNTPAIRGQLSALGLNGFFRTIVISEEVGLYKPDPAILLRACRDLRIAPSDALYVGDHPYDIVCAHAAGMPVAWMPFNRFIRRPEEVNRPEFVISGLAELKNILR